MIKLYEELPLRTRLRNVVIDALSNAETARGPKQDDFKATDVTKVNVWDSPLDPIQDICGVYSELFVDDDPAVADQLNALRKELPAVAVYTHRTEWDVDDYKNPTDCQMAMIDLDLEIYACGENGYELEAELDELERQMIFKIFTAPGFRNIAFKIRSMSSTPSRDPELSSNFGMRRISLTVVSEESFKPNPEVTEYLCLKATIKVSEDPDTPVVTLGDMLK